MKVIRSRLSCKANYWRWLLLYDSIALLAYVSLSLLVPCLVWSIKICVHMSLCAYEFLSLRASMRMNICFTHVTDGWDNSWLQGKPFQQAIVDFPILFTSARGCLGRHAHGYRQFPRLLVLPHLLPLPVSSCCSVTATIHTFWADTLRSLKTHAIYSRVTPIGYAVLSYCSTSVADVNALSALL